MPLLILASCRKKDTCDEDSSYHELNPCLHSFIFDTGSYWIYKNSLNTNMDSVFVEKCEFEVIGYKNGGSGCQPTTAFESINTEFNSTINGLFTTFMHYDMVKPGQDLEYENRLFDCSNMESLDSLELQNQTFYNILKIETINPNAKLFYKEDVGLIRKIVFDSIQDSIVFDLIEYQTVAFVLP